MKKLFKAREMTAFLFLVALFLVVGVINPDFLRGGENIAACFNGAIVYILVAVGMAFTILIGEIDVSVGSNLGLVAAVVGTMMQNGESWIKAFLFGLIIGIIVGLINGWGVAVMKIPSLIFTLGTNGVLRGMMFLMVGTKQVTDVPVAFKNLSSKSVVGPLTVFFCCTVVLVAVIQLLMSRTKRGRYFIAVGDNAGGADLVGIPATRTKVLAYVICGILAAVAGILFCSRAGQVTSLSGNGYEMKAVAACVLGGISLSGGLGSVVGAAVGAIIMSSISYLLVFMKLSSYYDNVITGIVLLIIVVLDALMQHRSAVNNRHARLVARTATAGVEKGGEEQ